jgi:hypothetical protein
MQPRHNPDFCKPYRKTPESRHHVATHLEGDLGALVLGDTTASLVGRTAAATAEASTTTTATSSARTTPATATATAEAATATTRSIIIPGGTGSAEVETDGTTVQLGTVEVVEGLASLVNRRELHVTEALGAARLGVGGQTDSNNGTRLTEELRDGVLVGAEGDVANEQGVALGAGLVTEVTSASLSAVLVVVVVGLGRAASGVVEVDLAAIDLSVLLGRVSLGSIRSADVLDITKPGCRLVK